ncbi:MAG: LamG-like jellyroll fold domain-containing protein, partial [Acidimicrobiia bacterium]
MLPRIEWSMLMRGSGAVEMARKFFGGSRVARVAVTTAVLAAATIGTGIVQTSATTPAGGALTFDGVNDYVTMGVASSLGATNFTLEAWVNRTGPGATTSTGSLTSVIPILAKGRGEGESPNNLNFNYFLGIDNSTGALVADFEEVTGPNHPVTSTTVVPMNSWHHVAATYDGRIFRLFMDGVLIQSLTVAATPLPPVLPQSASIQHASVGSALNSGGAAAGFFAGQIDEARIWSTARAQSDIQIGMSQEITSGTGLLGRFGFNEGSGATAGNSVAGNPNGTLTNGPTWSSGFPQPSAGDALNMGTSGFVSFGDPAKLDLAQFTIETWFRRSGAGTPNTTGDGGIASFEPLVTHGAPESETGNLNANWLLGISTVNVASPVLAADFEDSNNGLNHPVSGTTVITNNVWHHAAATYDGTTWRLYLDGNLEATEAVPFTLSGSQTPRSDSIQGAGLGAMFTSLGTPLGRFNGSLDEARVWNAARSEADIRSTINNSSLTSGTGLVARWGLGDPVGGAVIDSIGTPANGGVAGVGADRVTGAPFNLTFGDPPLVLVGAGDVADCARTQDEATAALVAGIDGHVFTIGDNVYENGTAAEFANCYDPGWGQFKNRTRPTLGNHDYGNGTTPGATPYFDYFNGVGNQTGPAGERGLGYYSYNIGSGANTWHIVVLNAECEPGTGYWVPGGCAAGSPQDLWLQNDLATSPTNNIIAMWHKPRFSSTGNFPHMQQLYQDLYNGGVELVLGGHWHNYEVLAPMDASGAIDNVYGVRQMVIGTGGVAPTGFGTVLPSSQVRNSVTNGVVKFTLHEDSYDWEFIPIAGQTFTDSGSTVTHDAPPTPTGDALDLGTAGAYVTFGDPAKLDLAQFTLETWFKRTGTGTANTSGSGGIDLIPLVTHGAPESDGSNVDANWIMGINTAGNVLAADFEDTATGANHPVSGTTAIPADGSWHHAAATYDGTTWRLYLDGNLEATSVVGAFTPRSDTTQQAALGTMLTSTGTALGRFVGTLDEARVWNTARTLTDIRATANSELTSGTGLVARWSLGDASGTNVADSIAPTANGTVTGTGATWVNGAPFDLTFDTVAPAAPSGLTANGTVTANDLAWTANAEPDVASYRVYRSTTSPVSIAGAPLATVNAPAVVYADTTAVAGTPYFYVVTAVDGSGNESPASGEATATRLSASGTALQLGTAGAYVTFGDPAELDLGTFTIETWFNRTGTGVSNTTGTNGIENFLPLVTHGGPQSENSNVDANWLLGINTTGNVLAADFEDNAGGTNHPVSGTTAITSNVWHHAAATYDGTTWRLYLDGNLEATLAVNATPRADSIQHAAIGTMLNSSGAPGNTARFHGIIDEARVWSGARNLQQIRTTMNSQLTTGTNLVARWGLEEGTGTAVSDSVAPASNGTITGTGSSWVPGAPFNLVNPNTAPNAPTNPVPANASTNVATSPTLSVDVSDVDNDELQVDFYGRSLGAGDPFTFVVIPDTQHYVDANGANLTHFASQVNWIVDNKDTLDIAFVSHLGDITESFDTVPAEWTRASAQMAVLDAAGVPNNMAPGNHDMLANGTATNYDIHFPPSRYDMNTWYGGYLGDSGDPVPESVDRLNKDNYQLFTAGGIDFLIIHLEVDMPQFTLDWASDVLEQYPNRHAIISTHAFVNTSNNRGTSVIHQTNGTTAAHVWDTVIRNHCNVFMVVNGHYPGEGRRTDNNDCGEPVHQVLTDYQSRTQGGSSWLRYYRFTPATNQIEAFTYATSTNTFETDSDSSFVLPFDMSAAAGFQLIGSTTVPSGSTASVVWNGLDTNQQYEWYAVARDGIASTDGPVSSFTTAAPVNATPTANASAPSVVEDTATPVALSGSDVETCELTFAIVTPPTNGTLGSIGNSACVAGAPNTDSASVTYTPNANFNGADSFTYTVSDGLNTSAPATVSITVSATNDAPTAV